MISCCIINFKLILPVVQSDTTLFYPVYKSWSPHKIFPWLSHWILQYRIINKWLSFHAAFPCPPTWAVKMCCHRGDFKVWKMIIKVSFSGYVFSDSVVISLSCRWTWRHYHFAFDAVQDKALRTPRSKYVAFIGRGCLIHHVLTPRALCNPCP